jgi:hypothetical protein
MCDKEREQMHLFGEFQIIVHYFDRNGALRSGRLVRRIRKGKKKGAFVVIDSEGRKVVTQKVRNIEYT